METIKASSTAGHNIGSRDTVPETHFILNGAVTLGRASRHVGQHEDFTPENPWRAMVYGPTKDANGAYPATHAGFYATMELAVDAVRFWTTVLASTSCSERA